MTGVWNNEEQPAPGHCRMCTLKYALELLTPATHPVHPRLERKARRDLFFVDINLFNGVLHKGKALKRQI